MDGRFPRVGEQPRPFRKENGGIFDQFNQCSRFICAAGFSSCNS